MRHRRYIPLSRIRGNKQKASIVKEKAYHPLTINDSNCKIIKLYKFKFIRPDNDGRVE